MDVLEKAIEVGREEQIEAGSPAADRGDDASGRSTAGVASPTKSIRKPSGPIRSRRIWAATSRSLLTGGSPEIRRPMSARSSALTPGVSARCSQQVHPTRHCGGGEAGAHRRNTVPRTNLVDQTGGDGRHHLHRATSARLTKLSMRARSPACRAPGLTAEEASATRLRR